MLRERSFMGKRGSRRNAVWVRTQDMGTHEHDGWECKWIPMAGHISKTGILSDPANPFLELSPTRL